MGSNCCFPGMSLCKINDLKVIGRGSDIFSFILAFRLPTGWFFSVLFIIWNLLYLTSSSDSVDKSSLPTSDHYSGSSSSTQSMDVCTLASDLAKTTNTFFDASRSWGELSFPQRSLTNYLKHRIGKVRLMNAINCWDCINTASFGNSLAALVLSSGYRSWAG